VEAHSGEGGQHMQNPMPGRSSGAGLELYCASDPPAGIQVGVDCFLFSKQTGWAFAGVENSLLLPELNL
jgi:hypothetical protein